MKMLHRIEQILTGRTVEEVWAHYVDRVAQFGFPHVVYSGHRMIGAIGKCINDDGLALSSMPTALCDELHERDLCAYLPMFSWLTHNQGSESWDWFHQRHREGALSHDEVQCLEIFSRHGHDAGFAIGLSDRVPRVQAGVLLMGALGVSQARMNSFWKSRRREIELLTTAMHQRLSNLPYRHPEQSLTLRQREALEMTGIGLTTQEIANQLAVTPGTIEKHLRLARKALNARTTAQAVLLAMSKRQIFSDVNFAQASAPTPLDAMQAVFARKA